MGVHLDNGGALINLTTIANNKITGIETIYIIYGPTGPLHRGLLVHHIVGCWHLPVRNLGCYTLSETLLVRLGVQLGH